MTVESGEEKSRIESAALLLLSLSNTDVNERKPLRYCRWSAAEDRLLAQLVSKKYGTWKKIAERIPGRTVRQTRSRWLKLCKKYQLSIRGKQDVADENELRHEEHINEQLPPPPPPPPPIRLGDCNNLIVRRILPPTYTFTVEPEKSTIRYHEPQRMVVTQLPPNMTHIPIDHETNQTHETSQTRMNLKDLPMSEMAKALYVPKDPTPIRIGPATIMAYRCLYPECNRIFQTRGYLSLHVVQHTKTTQQYYCGQCGRQFLEKEPYDMHLIDHDVQRYTQTKQ